MDLYPEIDDNGKYTDKDYEGLDTSKVLFPIKFGGQVDVNSDNDYKTKKIVLTKITELSGEPQKTTDV